MTIPLKLARHEKAFVALKTMERLVDENYAATLQAVLASLPQMLLQLGYLQTMAILSNRQHAEKVVFQALIIHLGAVDSGVTNTQLRQLTAHAVRFAHSLKVLSKQTLMGTKDAPEEIKALTAQELESIDQRHIGLQSLTHSYKNELHQGLRFEKFFDSYAKIQESSEWRHDWVNRFEKIAIGSQTSLDATHEDMALLAVKCLGGRAIEGATAAPLTIGLGYENAIENGMLWHHTLGVPYLPASSVKGLLRAWMSNWADSEPDNDGALLDEWFGTTKQAGKLIVFDALPCQQVWLETDVTTPHWGAWGESSYFKVGDTDGTNFPADWIDPKPVHWLRVPKGTRFTFYLSLKNPTDSELNILTDHLKSALIYLGAGAKTAAGYGRFQFDKAL